MKVVSRPLTLVGLCGHALAVWGVPSGRAMNRRTVMHHAASSSSLSPLLPIRAVHAFRDIDHTALVFVGSKKLFLVNIGPTSPSDIITLDPDSPTQRLSLFLRPNEAIVDSIALHDFPEDATNPAVLGSVLCLVVSKKLRRRAGPVYGIRIVRVKVIAPLTPSAETQSSSSPQKSASTSISSSQPKAPSTEWRLEPLDAISSIFGTMDALRNTWGPYCLTMSILSPFSTSTPTDDLILRLILFGPAGFAILDLNQSSSTTSYRPRAVVSRQCHSCSSLPLPRVDAAVMPASFICRRERCRLCCTDGFGSIWSGGSLWRVREVILVGKTVLRAERCTGADGCLVGQEEEENCRLCLDAGERILCASFFWLLKDDEDEEEEGEEEERQQQKQQQPQLYAEQGILFGTTTTSSSRCFALTRQIPLKWSSHRLFPSSPSSSSSSPSPSSWSLKWQNRKISTSSTPHQILIAGTPSAATARPSIAPSGLFAAILCGGCSPSSPSSSSPSSDMSTVRFVHLPRGLSLGGKGVRLPVVEDWMRVSGLGTTTGGGTGKSKRGGGTDQPEIDLSVATTAPLLAFFYENEVLPRAANVNTTTGIHVHKKRRTRLESELTYTRAPDQSSRLSSSSPTSPSPSSSTPSSSPDLSNEPTLRSLLTDQAKQIADLEAQVASEATESQRLLALIFEQDQELEKWAVMTDSFRARIAAKDVQIAGLRTKFTWEVFQKEENIREERDKQMSKKLETIRKRLEKEKRAEMRAKVKRSRQLLKAKSRMLRDLKKKASQLESGRSSRGGLLALVSRNEIFQSRQRESSVHRIQREKDELEERVRQLEEVNRIMTSPSNVNFLYSNANKDILVRGYLGFWVRMSPVSRRSENEIAFLEEITPSCRSVSFRGQADGPSFFRATPLSPAVRMSVFPGYYGHWKESLRGKPTYKIILERGRVGISKYVRTRGMQLRDRLFALQRGAKSIRVLHSRNLVHRDICTSNLMVFGGDGGGIGDEAPTPENVKLLDFEDVGPCPCELLDWSKVSSPRFTDPCLAAKAVELREADPEIEEAQDEHGLARDIFSFGVTIFEIVYLVSPWKTLMSVVHEWRESLRDRNLPVVLARLMDTDTTTPSSQSTFLSFRAWLGTEASSENAVCVRDAVAKCSEIRSFWPLLALDEKSSRTLTTGEVRSLISDCLSWDVESRPVIDVVMRRLLEAQDYEEDDDLDEEEEEDGSENDEIMGALAPIGGFKGRS